MKFKSYKLLIATLSLTMAAAVPMASMYMSNPVEMARVNASEPAEVKDETETRQIVYGDELKEVDAQGRVIYLGEKAPVDMKEKILSRLGIDNVDKISMDKVKVELTGELVEDKENKGEIIESNEALDVMEVKDGEVTFSRSGCFLADLTVDGEVQSVIFNVGDTIVSYADLNDWAVEKGTYHPDFLKSTLVKFDDEEVKSIEVDDSKVNENKDGTYLLTYTITDKDGKETKQAVTVTVGDKETVKEMAETGVWIATSGISIKTPDVKTEKAETEAKVCVAEESEDNCESVSQDSSDDKAASNDKVETNTGKDDSDNSETPKHEHKYGEGVVTKAATCTETGVMTYTCEGCGETKTEEIPALGHKYDEGVVTKEATCTETGVLTYTCETCGETKTEEIPMLEHNYDAGVVTKEPTCTETGVMTYTCEDCGATKTEEIPALGHEYTYEITKEPTCTETGVKTYTCTRCGDTYEEEIPALGHDETEVITKEPTCTETGVRTYTCTRCGEVRTEEIPALGHEYTSEVTKEPTCTETGVRTYTCTRCGDTYEEEIPALGHNMKETITKNATCTENGQKVTECTRCGESHTEEIPALGHEYTSQVTKAATCTEDGVKTYTCTRCGDNYTEAIPALGHNWEHHEATGHEEVIEKAWTEYKEIWKYQCNGCGMEFDTPDEAGNHILESFDDACENYSSVFKGYDTIEHPAVTQWVWDTPAYDICTTCGEKVEK